MGHEMEMSCHFRDNYRARLRLYRTLNDVPILEISSVGEWLAGLQAEADWSSKNRLRALIINNL